LAVSGSAEIISRISPGAAAGCADDAATDEAALELADVVADADWLLVAAESAAELLVAADVAALLALVVAAVGCGVLLADVTAALD